MATEDVGQPVSSFLQDDEQFGSDDDARVLSECLKRASRQAATSGQPMVVDLEGLEYKCEDSVKVENVEGDLTIQNGTIYAETDLGPYAPETARNRAHLILRGGGTARTRHLTIRGPNELGRRSGTYLSESLGKIRDYLEQQCGIWALTEHFESLECDISMVWGDYISLGARGSGRDLKMMETATVIPGVWDKNGRVGLLAHSKDLVFRGGGDPEKSVIKTCRSTTYHVESGAGSELNHMRSHRVEGLYQAAGNARFFHYSGGAWCDSITVTNNLRKGWPVNLVLLAEKKSDGTRAIGSFVATGNIHDKAQSGDYFVRVRNTDSVVYQYNEGPLRNNYPVERQLVFEQCGSVVRKPNRLWLAGETPPPDSAPVDETPPADVEPDEDDRYYEPDPEL